LALGVLDLGFYSLVVFFFVLKKAPILLRELWLSLWNSKKGVIGKFILLIVTCLKSAIIVISDYEIIYYSTNMLFNMGGLTIHPFFYVGCMAALMRMP
jgi:hypothetical protein